MAHLNILILAASLLLVLVTIGFGQYEAVQDFNHLILVVSVVLMGLSMGSFATALIYRLPRGIPFSSNDAGKPVRSVCPPCGRVLTPWELVPVFSWLWQKGRCKCGRLDVPIFYPVTELLTLAYTYLLFLANGFDLLDLPRYAAVPFAVAVAALAYQGQPITQKAGRILTGMAIVIFMAAILEGWSGQGINEAEIVRRGLVILAFGSAAFYSIRSVLPDLGRTFPRQEDVAWLAAGVAVLALLCPAPILFVFGLAGAAALVADGRGLSPHRPVFPIALAAAYVLELLLPPIF